jgi:hypothetical protein
MLVSPPCFFLFGDIRRGGFPHFRLLSRMAQSSLRPRFSK